MGFNILSVFGKVGSFLLDALKRATGATSNTELLTKIFETAGGYILATERDSKQAVKSGGDPIPWEQKLKKATLAVVDHYAAQGIDIPLHVAVVNVANKFAEINEQKLAAGKPGLVSSDNQSPSYKDAVSGLDNKTLGEINNSSTSVGA